MIKPGLIRAINVKPEAVHLAFTGWALFTASVPRGTAEGVGILNISYDLLMGDFFDRLLLAGGTEQDIKWLVAKGVMGVEDRKFWVSSQARLIRGERA